MIQHPDRCSRPRFLAGAVVVMLNPAADGTESNGHQPGDLTAEDAAGPAEGPEDTAPIPDLPAPDLAAGPGGADPAEVVVRLITGVIAGGQRHYYSSSSANCAQGRDRSRDHSGRAA